MRWKLVIFSDQGLRKQDSQIPNDGPLMSADIDETVSTTISEK